MKKLFIITASFLCCIYSHAADYKLASPDGCITTEIQTGNEVNIKIGYQGKEYLSIPHVCLTTDKQTLGTNVIVRKAVRRSISQTLHPVYGINKAVRENYNELRLDCKGDYAIIFRAYNEGIAWRFATRMGKNLIVKDEQIDYQFADNYKAFFHPALSEADYRIQTVSDKSLKPNYSSMPVLVKPDDKMNILLHESDVRDYPCMSLMSSGKRANTLTTIHAKHPKTTLPGGHKNFNLVVKETEDYIARTRGTREFPWRIIAFAKDDKDILDNQLVWLLGAKCQLPDTEWIRPGKVAWDWWDSMNLTGVGFKAGINTDTYKYYIDFATKNGIEYINLDEGWSDQFNLLKVNPQIDMEELTRYARSRGVGLFLWCVWHTLDKQMAEALEAFGKWGIAGLKVDFMDRDDQMVVCYEERLLKEAARHKLLVNFHGAYHPNGLERTYPNCINVDGVKGLEWNKIAGTGATPTGAVTIPFIRMFAGPMDYTPGAMTNSNQEDWRMIKKHPMSQGTRCQQLAMYVVYNAPLQMLADSPTAYEKEPKYLKFLASIPTTWDETLPLESRVGKYVNIARRKEDSWFVAGMADWEGHTQDIKLDFLDGNDTYIAEFVEDGMNADRIGSDYTMKTAEVKPGETLTMHMAPGGGYAIKLTPRNKKQNVVIFGDSRVQLGGDWCRHTGRKDVVNAGFGGFTTSHFIWLIRQYVIERHPRVCFLEGGINDIGSGIPLARTMKNYRSLVDSLLAHGIEVVMHAITYPTEKDPEMQSFKVGMIDSLNIFIHHLAKEKGLPCIDLNPILTDGKRLKKEYAFDNVHFTAAAYAIWAEEMKKILKEKGI